MTAPAPCGAASIRPLGPNQAKKVVDPTGDTHPDVLEYARSLGRRVSAAELRYLQAEYDRGMSERDRRADRPAPASPALVRSGRVRLVTGELVDASVVADPLAERVAGRLDRRRRSAA